MKRASIIVAFACVGRYEGGMAVRDLWNLHFARPILRKSARSAGNPSRAGIPIHFLGGWYNKTALSCNYLPVVEYLRR